MATRSPQEVVWTAEQWWAYTQRIKYDLDADIPKLIHEDGGIAMQIVSGPFSMLENGEPYAAIHPDVEALFIKQFANLGIRAERIVWNQGDDDAQLSL